MEVSIRPELPADREAVWRVHNLAFGDSGRVAGLVDALRATPAVLEPVSLVAVSSAAVSSAAVSSGAQSPDAGGGVAGGGVAGGGVAGGGVVGHVMLTASRLDAPERLVDVYVLSPVGVLPDLQGQGIGTVLIGHALAAARETGVPLVFLEGSPEYYGARGFERAGDLGFRKPSLRIPDDAFQVARMPGYEPWMSGTLVYSEPFWAHDCVGLREAH
jgi:putative acetyltransferase